MCHKWIDGNVTTCACRKELEDQLAQAQQERDALMNRLAQVQDGAMVSYGRYRSCQELLDEARAQVKEAAQVIAELVAVAYPRAVAPGRRAKARAAGEAWLKAQGAREAD